jgi:hypothetical protein
MLPVNSSAVPSVEVYFYVAVFFVFSVVFTFVEVFVSVLYRCWKFFGVYL